MLLPPLHGSLNQKNFFIYTACDSVYFDEFGRSFVNSVLRNTSAGVHIHIYNPSQLQLDFCLSNSRISHSYEIVTDDLFSKASNRWNLEPTTEEENLRKIRTLTAMAKGGDKTISERVLKTYYACARFARLKDLTSVGDKFLALDVDAIVRSNIPVLSTEHDCYMYKITGRKARILAGGLYSNGTVESKRFIDAYATLLLSYINDDYLYWSLDQDVLDHIVPNYNIGDLPYTLIDWEMKPSSVVWTAKGLRKDLEIFISEKKKYNV